MKRKLTKNQQKEIIINFIKKNPSATYKLIRKETKLHPERIFKSLKNAFKEAKMKEPRTFERKTKEQRKKIIINCIKENPKIGGQTIMKKTKINLSSSFKNIEEAYEFAGVKYPRKERNRLRKKSKFEKEKEIIDLIRKNPLLTLLEINKKTGYKANSVFKNMKEMYEKADIKKIRGYDKRKIKKQMEIINFIRENTLATQREINQNCKTHVQNLFQRGIFEAYEKADIKFPFERLKLYGIGLEKIRKRAKNFEEEISTKLSGYGKVNRLVKTKRGFADVIFERKGKKAIIEIKDYQNKEISISQIKQLNKYLEDCNCNLGFLICRKKPRKDKFLIDKNKIFVLNEEELTKIPNLI